MTLRRSCYLKAAAALLALGALGGAQARDNIYWSVGIDAAPGVSVGVGNTRPVVVAPPVYVQPAPVYGYGYGAPVYTQPQVIYPRPVYVQPAPVYVQPAPVYGAGYYGPPGHWRHRHHGYGNGHGRGHDRHDRHDRHRH